MKCVRSTPLALVVASILLAVGVPSFSAAVQPAQSDALTVVDFGGKEHKVSGWKLTAGGRRLHWLATEEEKKAAKLPALAGPEALEISEGKPPLFKNRVLTLVPIKHVRSIAYDHKASTVTIKVAKTADTDVVLTGPTGYVGVNQIAIDAEEDLGPLGKAEIKFLGGTAQGIKSVAFPKPVALDALPKGRSAEVTTTDKNNKSFTAINLLPLYQQSNKTQLTEPSLSFQKTVRIEMDKLLELSHVDDGGGKGNLVFDVKAKGGLQKPLTLIEQRPTEMKQSEELIGMIGRVEVGYKLAPMATLQSVKFDAGE